MKDGLESAGRALSIGLYPFRVDCCRVSLTEILVAIYHPSESVKLTYIQITNDHTLNPFAMNAIIARLQKELKRLSAYVEPTSAPKAFEHRSA
ncbi:hypothetical protein [Pseudomonas oryzihabitans]|uniref:hypothetical protein n=1 Tax=Pseudomonas oryzihabitans TaxID=47885 RepID=UPI002895906F|nr:hypothetical protein [Pseudomonas oryzihabitans]MDT3723108.1 hypothetical protein [Pseudomonas oryzihabitans]